MKKILIIGALPSSLFNFRGELIKQFIDRGYDVVVMASGATQKEIDDIQCSGLHYIDYPIQRNGLNPYNDFKTYLFLRNVFKVEQPSYIFAYTIKPVIWGGLASRKLNNVEFTALITGLGFAFQAGSLLKNALMSLVVCLYKAALKKANVIIFQNVDNRFVFIDKKIITLDKARIVNGSGVDIDRFKYSKVDTKQTKFLLIARLLKDKGIDEYIKAAKIVKKDYPDVEFQLLGPEDPSPNHFSMEIIKENHNKGIINYLGETDDVLPYIKACQIFTLPSYHEGLPRTVIEAMSIGRAILTTNAAGCKDTVVEGENGFIVPVKDSESLAEKMKWFIENKTRWEEMGIRSRELVEQKFDVKKVNAEIIKIMRI